MPDNEEDLRSILGIPTPKADPDEAWLRAVAGIPSFTNALATGGVSNGPVFSPTMSPMFSPANPPILLTRA